MTRVSVPTETTAGGETNAYLVDGPDGSTLVDPAARTEALDAAVAERNVDHVVVTHTHPDHVGAVAHYAAETGATVWARRGHVDAFEAETGVSVDEMFAEGSVVDTDAGSVTVLDTPGHARDHVAFEVDFGNPADRTQVLCGDLAVAEGSVVVGAPEGDMRAYLTGLRRLRARDPDRLLPGHGPPIDDPWATIDRLIDHRLAREVRVRRAVDGGARTLDEVVDAAYDKDLSGLRDLARATVRAHLEKLAVEGKVEWDRTAKRASIRGSDGV